MVDAIRQAALPKLERAIGFAAQQCRRIVDSDPDAYPMYTVEGRWGHVGESWTHWCEGFFPGMLWLIHMHTRDEWFGAAAERYSKRLEPRRFDENVHDLGFLFLSTYLRWYRRHRQPEHKQIVIEAGQTLAKRFREPAGYLCSFLGPRSLFVDIMMNVPVIYYAAQKTGDERLLSIANRHVDATAKFIVRPNGSCAHEALFDDAGNFVSQSTQQGLRADSDWSRGIAWALYGFGTVSQYSKNPEHLAVAERIADFWLTKTAGNPVPLWDFSAADDAAAPKYFDSSAGAIAASGLWNLSHLSADRSKREAYRNRAIQTAVALAEPDFLAIDRPEQEGVLLHGVYHLHKNLGVDESVIWGDHFFVEALVKILSDAKTIEV